MARFTPPASSSADPACEDHPWKLETWLLENSTSHATVFQKILTKVGSRVIHGSSKNLFDILQYDREYGEDELGGQLLDMYSSETAYTQVDKLFGNTACVYPNYYTDPLPTAALKGSRACNFSLQLSH